MTDYLNFELEIKAAGEQAYSISVHSPGGEVDNDPPFVLPFEDFKLSQYAAQDLGQRLFGALLADKDVRTCYELSRQQAAHQELGLRIQLRTSDPILMALPWEYLYDPNEGEFLSLMSNISLVHYIQQKRPILPLEVHLPLRVLCMAPSPKEFAQLDVSKERQLIDNAISELKKKGDLEVHWLEGRQSWRNLNRVLTADGPWHIFHFIGHGGFDIAGDQGLLAFEDENSGNAKLISATDLSRILTPKNSPLRLVLLNACDSAHSGQEPFSSIAAMLARRGLPAVIAMQHPITDPAAIEFSRSFYGSIVVNPCIDTAVYEARKAIAIELNPTLEWGVPVIYLRSQDGRLFDIHHKESENPTGISVGDISNISGSVISIGSGNLSSRTLPRHNPSSQSPFKSTDHSHSDPLLKPFEDQ